jgi:hypothetical protein
MSCWPYILVGTAASCRVLQLLSCVASCARPLSVSLWMAMLALASIGLADPPRGLGMMVAMYAEANVSGAVS